MPGIISLIVLFLLFVGVVPAWPYSRRWNYVPSVFFGFALAAAMYLVLGGQS